MPSPEHPEPSLREGALAALCQADPAAKVAAAHALWQRLHALPDEAARTQALQPTQRIEPAAGTALPGRPAQPLLVAPSAVPQRSPFTADGLAALLHAVCHIEFNAIKIPFNDSHGTIIKFH